MAVGFDTGAKWYDNYFEAYYEVIECYYQQLDNQYFDYSDYYKDNILPAAREVANSLKGVYRNLGSYYEDYYRNYFNENAWSTIWAGYGYGGCDVEKIIKKWGFSPRSNDDQNEQETSDENKNIETSEYINQPKKYNKKYADKIINFNPSIDIINIDTESFGISNSATFAAGKNKKEIKRKLAKLDIDFLYDQKKGGLYFNENGADKGFGDGGIIAILKGAPNLNIDTLNFI